MTCPDNAIRLKGMLRPVLLLFRRPEEGMKAFLEENQPILDDSEVIYAELIDSLVLKKRHKDGFSVMDGLGGLPMPGRQTELENSPHTKPGRAAGKSICSLLDPVGYGITPGSGPPISPCSFTIHQDNVRGLFSHGSGFSDDPGTWPYASTATIDKKVLLTGVPVARLEENERRAGNFRNVSAVFPGSGGEIFFRTEMEYVPSSP